MASNYQQTLLQAWEDCITAAGGSVPAVPAVSSFERRLIHLVSELVDTLGGDSSGVIFYNWQMAYLQLLDELLDVL